MRASWVLTGWMLNSAIRRLSQRTGVTDAEAFRSLPGDEVIPHPMAEWNRGVTVRAEPKDIWPWLVQMGYGRAGWYTPTWVDRIVEPTLFRQHIPSPRSATRLLPEHQSLAVGDVLADGPQFRAFWRVLAVEPHRAIVYRSIRHPWLPNPVDPNDPEALRQLEEDLIAKGVYLDCTWTFVLHREAEGKTRLLVRTRGNYAPASLRFAVPLIGLYDATYGVAMLQTIRRRVEEARAAGESDYWPHIRHRGRVTR